MQLHQLLRIVDLNIPIILFNMNFSILEEAETKDKLSIKYYESDVYKITVSFQNTFKQNTLCVILLEY